MTLTINYYLHNAGWALAEISAGKQAIRASVSYLHDSLGNLAEAALHLLTESLDQQKVVFMDEPGEHQLVLTPSSTGDIHIELRWYNDWQSWNMYPEDRYSSLLQTVSTPTDFALTVKGVLDAIWIKYGSEGYKEKWIEHEFPYNQYRKLIYILPTGL